MDLTLTELSLKLIEAEDKINKLHLELDASQQLIDELVAILIYSKIEDSHEFSKN